MRKFFRAFKTLILVSLEELEPLKKLNIFISKLSLSRIYFITENHYKLRTTS